MTIFQKSVIKLNINNLDKEQVEKAYQKFKKNYNPTKIEKIKLLKEEEYQDGFLRDLFVDVFNYTLKPDDNYNLVREFKNQADGKKADGAILKDEKAISVIELKSTKTKDLKSITEQAFNYKNNQPDCKYVITSNFQKLRFYIDYANEFEEFDLFHLQKDDFELLYLILNKNSIFSDLPLKLKEETKFHEQEISDKLYKDYSNFKRKLFDNLTKNHPESNKLTLFKKSQKLLDRFLFILFAEDSGLLPPNSISRIIKRYEILKDEDAYKPLYDIFKQYFGYMNIGRKGKTEANNIPAYNGGLFYPDELLDNIKIDDEILINDLLKLSEYDFNTEVDVNILGHIFEHSLSEIEEITAEIKGTSTDKTKSKRKKDGVFYTPKYITQYIVENTIGTLCTEKRKELDIIEIEFDGTYRIKNGKLSTKGKKLYQKLMDYKDWLLSLKIVDPACGSGAFLNQALNFLIAEHKNIDDIIAELTNTALRLFDTDKAILENNLYGVDINEESVEIAKLSLWLRTAQKDRKLSNLNSNIKCGNSLINDPEIAGDKAFDWNVEFKEIMNNGGFDFVIGNPPYVNARNMKDIERQYLSNKHSELKGAWDLYVPFLLLGENIGKTRCYGWIIPNKLLINDYGINTINRLKSNGLNQVINISSLPIFKNVGVYPIILINNNSSSDYKEYILKSESDLNDIKKYEKHKNSFKRFKTIKDFNILINSGTTGFEAQKIKPLINEKSDGVNFAVSGNIDPYIISMDRVPYMKSIYTYPSIKIDKKIIAESKIKFWLRPKVVVAGMTKKIEAYYTDKPLALGVGIYGIYEFSIFNPLFILSILNSKFITFYLNIEFKDKHLAGGYLAINKSTLEQLPFVETNNQQPFVEKADKMLELNKNFQEKKNKFLNRVKDNFEIGKISKKLKTFYNYDFKTFIAELKKQKINISLVQQDEWEEYFTSYKTEINNLQSEINQTDKKIDQMVYELYELTDEEIRIVEGN